MSVAVRGVLHTDAVRGPRRARFSSMCHDTRFYKENKRRGLESIVRPREGDVYEKVRKTEERPRRTDVIFLCFVPRQGHIHKMRRGVLSVTYLPFSYGLLRYEVQPRRLSTLLAAQSVDITLPDLFFLPFLHFPTTTPADFLCLNFASLPTCLLPLCYK